MSLEKNLMVKKVKYRLVRDSNGYKTPICVLDGGHMWSANGPLDQIVLYGTANIEDSNNLPEGIIELIDDEIIAQHMLEMKMENLKKHKRQLYERECDPLFFEAFRDKCLGNDSKWLAYLDKCKKIHDMETVR